jgi:very-short-patch-repair endonuclease
MRQGPDDRCIRIASHQRGLVTLAQARETGVSRGSIQWRVDSGRWVRILPGVYAVTHALDSAMRRGLTHIPRIRERLSDIGTQGRAGTRTLQRLLTDRELGSGLTESPLEVKVERALHRARLDPPERQFAITCPDGLRIRLDFAWPEQRVGIEADGFRWHTDFEQWQQDARRHNLLQEMGWRIVRATHRSLHENPDALPRQVATLLGQTRLTLEV